MLRAACRSQNRGCALLPPVCRVTATPKPLVARPRARQLCAQAARSQCFYAPRETDTAHLAALLSRVRLAGDCICLHGAVGTGKSVFSRAYIRATGGDDQLPVPSPTYLIQNIYDFEEGPPVHHFDLYRLSGGADLQRLDLSQSLAHATSLFEWADRLQSAMPAVRLDVHLHTLSHDQESSRQAMVGGLDSGSGDESEEEDQYIDKQSRVICLEPRGLRWEGQLADIVQTLSSSTTESGLQVVPDVLLSKLK